MTTGAVLSCRVGAQTLLVFLCASVVHPSQLPSSVVEYDTHQYATWVVYRVFTFVAVLGLFLIGSREHERTRRDVFIVRRTLWGSRSVDYHRIR